MVGKDCAAASALFLDDGVGDANEDVELMAPIAVRIIASRLK